MANQNGYVVRTEDVKKDLQLGEVTVHAVRGISLSVARGEFLGIIGPSGSGKSTLLNILGCLDRPTSGTYWLDGQDVSRMDDDALSDIRGTRIGFIFQSFNLVGVLTVFQNVEFPLLLQGHLRTAERRARVMELLDEVGLAEHARHRPNELSGGQRQRVAVARALVGRPQIVLADEPTANLDSVTGEKIIDLMKELNQRDGTTFIFSTHDAKVMSHADAIIRLADGKIVGRETPSSAGVAAGMH